MNYSSKSPLYTGTAVSWKFIPSADYLTQTILVQSQMLPVSRQAGAVAVQAAALLPLLSLGQGTVLHCCLNANGCSKRFSLKRTVHITVILEKKLWKLLFLVKSVGLAAGSEAAICYACITVNGETQSVQPVTPTVFISVRYGCLSCPFVSLWVLWQRKRLSSRI